MAQRKYTCMRSKKKHTIWNTCVLCVNICIEVVYFHTSNIHNAYCIIGIGRERKRQPIGMCSISVSRRFFPSSINSIFMNDSTSDKMSNSVIRLWCGGNCTIAPSERRSSQNRKKREHRERLGKFLSGGCCHRLTLIAFQWLMFCLPGNRRR